MSAIAHAYNTDDIKTRSNDALHYVIIAIVGVYQHYFLRQMCQPRFDFEETDLFHQPIDTWLAHQ